MYNMLVILLHKCTKKNINLMEIEEQKCTWLVYIQFT